MKNQSIVILLFIFKSIFCFAQTETILIDFGNNLSPAPWNNMTSPHVGKINQLLNNQGITTEISLMVVDSFGGINNTGTQMANSDLGIPPTASGDSFFGNPELFANDIQPTGGIQFSYLDTSKIYNLTIFASREATNNRETQYVLSSLNQDTAYLNASSNTDSIVVFSTYPATDGTLEINASTGPNNNSTYGFFYLGAMKIEYESDTIIAPQLALIEPNGGEFWQKGKEVKVVWNTTIASPTIIEYSIDNGANWLQIDTTDVFQKSLIWTVPDTPSDECLIRISSESLTDQSEATFEISSSTDTCPIVVIGSSTAAGAGASIRDSSWVSRYENEIYQNDTRYPVINIARGGYTTYHLLPTGNPLAADVGITIDTARNITKALSFNPSGVIINLPSNDAANSFQVDAQLTNFKLMVEEAALQNVKTWVCTTQPRNFSNPDQILLQQEARDSILAIYGNYALDFWSEIAGGDGFILPDFNSGDGVHLNDAGHRILFETVLNKNILDSLCQFNSVGIGELSTENTLEFKVYPNPFSTSFRVETGIENFEIKEVLLYDILGKLIFKKKNILATNKSIDISPKLSNGMKSQLLLLKIKGEIEGKYVEKSFPILFNS